MHLENRSGYPDLKVITGQPGFFFQLNLRLSTRRLTVVWLLQQIPRQAVPQTPFVCN
jgi:hypothetical protein